MARGGNPEGRSYKCPDTGLTRNQLLFVKGISDGKSYADAYRSAYKVDRIRPEEVQRRAWELSRLPVVAEELTRIRMLAREKCAYSIEDAVAEAELARQLAMDEKQASAATGAVALKAKLLGLMTDKIETTNKTVTPPLAELEKQLRDVMAQLGIAAPDDLAEVAKGNIVPINRRA